MKTITKTIAVLLLSALAISLSGCGAPSALILSGGDDSVPKDKVKEYVAEHVEKLSAFPYEAYLETKDDSKAGKQFIRDALGRDTIVRSVYRYQDGVVDFYCGGAGNVSASIYSGFFYSENDEPHAFEFENEAQFMQTSDGVYEWESPDSRHAFYAERILPGWFYYRMRWF